MNTLALQTIAEPSRLRIADFLRDGSHAVGEIAERLGIRQPQVSKHLKAMHDAKLVTYHKDAQKRIYQLDRDTFREFEAWAASYTKEWDARFDSLEEYVNELLSQDNDETEKSNEEPR